MEPGRNDQEWKDGGYLVEDRSMPQWSLVVMTRNGPATTEARCRIDFGRNGAWS